MIEGAYNHVAQQLVPLHTVPSPIEQQHINQALQDSQTAMSAIQSLLSLSQTILIVLSIFIAILALWGVSAVYRACCRAARQVAERRINRYIESEEFTQFMSMRIDVAVDSKLKELLLERVKEALRPADEEQIFPAKEGDE